MTAIIVAAVATSRWHLCPCTALGVLHMITHLMLITSLWAGFFISFYSGKNWGAQRLSFEDKFLILKCLSLLILVMVFHSTGQKCRTKTLVKFYLKFLIFLFVSWHLPSMASDILIFVKQETFPNIFTKMLIKHRRNYRMSELVGFLNGTCILVLDPELPLRLAGNHHGYPPSALPV